MFIVLTGLVLGVTRINRNPNWFCTHWGAAVTVSLLFASPNAAPQNNSGLLSAETTANPSTVLSVQLAFHGVSSELKSSATTLEFTGTGSSLSPVGADLSFEGIANDLKPIGSSMTFTGLGKTLKPIGDRLEFHGLGAQSMKTGGALAFTGVREIKPISARLAFTGIGDQSEHLDDPAILYGNWRVEWDNDGYFTPGLMTIYEGEDGSISVSGTRMRDDKADPIISRNMAALADGSYKIKWGYGHLGYWGGESIVRPSTLEHLSGQWGYRCEKPGLVDCQRTGTSSWARILPSFDEHLPLDNSPEGLFGAISSTPLPVTMKQGFSADQPIVLTAPNSPPSDNELVGFVHLALYGDDIFGPQNITVHGPSGLTFHTYSYICAFGDGAEYQLHWSQQVCETQGGIDGLYIALNVWSDALPNAYELVIQGERISILLEIEE